MGGPQKGTVIWGLSLFCVRGQAGLPAEVPTAVPPAGSRVKVTFSRKQSQERRHEKTH